MKRFQKIFIISFCSLFLTGTVFAAEGVVTYVKGKVEVQRNSEWVALNVGDTVAQSEVVNTGFQSEAKIKLMDSVLYLGPVTRITLESLKESDTTDKVNVFLSTGSTRSKVNHTENKKVSYTVHTAIAVASVRGTDWAIDSAGNVSCYEGGVAVATLSSLGAGSDRPAASAEEAGDEDSSGSLDDFENSPELPAGGVVVAANQSVSATENAPVTSPVTNSSRQVSDVYNAVASASSREGVASGSSGVSDISTMISSGGGDSRGSAGSSAAGTVVIDISIAE